MYNTLYTIPILFVLHYYVFHKDFTCRELLSYMQLQSDCKFLWGYDDLAEFSDCLGTYINISQLTVSTFLVKWTVAQHVCNYSTVLYSSLKIVYSQVGIVVQTIPTVLYCILGKSSLRTIESQLFKRWQFRQKQYLKVLSDENQGGSKLVSIDSSCFTVQPLIFLIFI